ncbi:MAG: GNAT family N-acetyltransferase [Alphaproteobacteria bacterium]|jgi:RimJ/RimL family protein N-acetyltransferase|nr:GNAT family N-acetyltransferase [Alphaproteobacteria bacterium]MDP6567133.1 GNAT family N-acetyltransferase [Alphaproteobacteria bacterium]MDP6813959.1 GNAT family N-acetyltransferase [Alphaproteobacteria bacterium]
MIRTLTAADAASYRDLRLQALRLEPLAFSASAEEEGAEPLSFFAGRLGENACFGAFYAEALIGFVGLRRLGRAKTRHRGEIWGMYVAEDHRGSGVARDLLEFVVESAGDLRQLELNVVADNGRAVRFYQGCGFVRTGVVPRAALVDGRYHDELVMVRDMH